MTFFLNNHFPVATAWGGFANPWIIVKFPTFPSVTEGDSTVLWLSAKQAEGGQAAGGQGGGSWGPKGIASP